MPPKKRTKFNQRKELKEDRLRQRRRLAAETHEKRKLRQTREREYRRRKRASETAEERDIRLSADRQRRYNRLTSEIRTNKERVCCLEEELTSLKRAITLTYGAQAMSRVKKNLNLLQKTSSIVNDPVHKSAEGIITKVASNVSEDVDDPLSTASTSSDFNKNCIPPSVLNANNSISNKKERRIIDVKHFFNEMKRVNKHSEFGCSLNDIVIMHETKRGIATSYLLQCEICNYRTVVHSEIFSGKRNLNIDIIDVMLRLNCDYNDINKFLDTLCLPSLSCHFFKKQLPIIFYQAATCQNTDSSTSCIIKGNSPKNLRKTSSLKPASLMPGELNKIPLHQMAKVPQIGIDQRANSLVACSENNRFLAKTSEQNLPSATCQASIPPKTSNEQTFIPKNLLQKAISKNTQKEPQAITLYAQTNMPSASNKSNNLHQNDSASLLLIKDEFEIKEENAIEDESELVKPDQLTEKPSSSKLIVGQEQATLNMVNIKQEIKEENAIEDESELVKPDQLTEKPSSSELIVGQEQATLNMVNIKQEIKEENAIEDESELVKPDQLTEKPSSSELIVGQETLNMVNIKQEIDPELNNECNLPLIDFNNMQKIDKNSKIDCSTNMSEVELPFLKKTRPVIDESEVVINQNLTKLGENKVEQKHYLLENCTKSITEYADQAFTMLPQQKEVKSYKNRKIVNPNQIILYHFGDILEDTRLVERRCLEKKDKGNVTDFDNLCEVELPIKKVRTAIKECKAVVNQDHIKLGETEAEQNLYSVENCEIFSKPKISEKKRTMIRKKCISSHDAKSRRITNGQKMLLSVYERNGHNYCRAEMNNVEDTKDIVMSVANKEKKFFESKSESNNFAIKTSAATTLDGKNMCFAPFQYMPQSNKNECAIDSQVLPNPANALYQDVSGTSCLSKVQTTTYQHLNSSNNDGSTYISDVEDQVRKSLNLLNNEQSSAASFQKRIAEET